MVARDFSFSRLPRHVGLIPDGNRRWAEKRGAPRRDGYAAGILPGVALLELCRDFGIHEASVYGFTKDNVRRPKDQVQAFQHACVDFCSRASAAGFAVKVFGDVASRVFPDALRPLAAKRSPGDVRVNLLVNYGWQWDLDGLRERGELHSTEIPRVELVVRWGGRRRLSGVLPAQCANADFFIVDALWPDMRPDEFVEALRWYQEQDVTLGG